jgi:phage terminase Nu1 subunit (DNA packaging protein)
MDAAFVNKDEMARLLGISKPTLTDLIAKYPDFPVAERGDKGRPYAFDAAAVLAWKQRHVEAAQAVAAEKTEFLAQFEFPVEDEAPVAPSAAQRVQLAKALQIERKLAMESGHLVPSATIRQAIQIALTVLGKRLDNLPGILGREFNLPEPVQRAMARQLDDARQVMARDIRDALTNESPDERKFA